MQDLTLTIRAKHNESFSPTFLKIINKHYYKKLFVLDKSDHLIFHSI